MTKSRGCVQGCLRLYIYLLISCVVAGVLGVLFYFLNSEIRERPPFRQPATRDQLAQQLLGYWRIDSIGGKKLRTLGLGGDVIAFRPIAEGTEWGVHEPVEPVWALLIRIIEVDFGDGTRQTWKTIDARHIAIETTGFAFVKRRRMHVYAYEIRFNGDGTSATWTPVPQWSIYDSPFESGRRRFREQHVEMRCTYLGRYKRGSEYLNRARVTKRSTE